MKKLVFVLMMAMMFGCDMQRQGADLNQEVNAALFKMAQMNGCTECHRVSAVVIGPSWETISDRYKDAPFADAKTLLVESVKKGSIGKYVTFKGGKGMPPLERRVSADHIEKLVEYILQLKRH